MNPLVKPFKGLIAHRGASNQAPENTLASFKQAHDKGFNWIEFDIRLTLDEHLVIFHDPTLERLAHLPGAIDQYLLNDLQKIDIGSWFEPRFHEERIPSLDKTLHALVEWGIQPVIEIKSEIRSSPLSPAHHKITAILADCLDKHWPITLPLPMVSSFDHQILVDYRARMGINAPIGFLIDHYNDHFISLVQNTPNAMLHCRADSFSELIFEKLDGSGIQVCLYTVNDPLDAKKYLQHHCVFAVFTDSIDPCSF